MKHKWIPFGTLAGPALSSQAGPPVGSTRARPESLPMSSAVHEKSGRMPGVHARRDDQPLRAVKARVPTVVLLLAVAAATAVAIGGQAEPPLPNRSGSLKFVAIGDNGTGESSQYEIARQMDRLHATFPFDLVIMLGDNMYGGQQPADFVKKFELPYAPLLSAGVKFQASLGNHDRPENVCRTSRST
jgi:hypothetical protein